MILVDSSVRVDYLRVEATPQADKLDALLGSTPLAIGDLTLTEVLQGCGTDKVFNEVRKLLGTLTLVTLGGEEVAVEVARNFRRLQSKGVAVRKTIHTIIATRCILDGHELLNADRDFDASATHLGLRCVTCEA